MSQKAAASEQPAAASAGDFRPPGENRVAPINPVKHVSQLHGGDRDHPIARRGPDKPAALQPLGVKRHADPVVPDDLEQVPSGAPEDVKIARMRVAAQRLLHLQRQPVHAFAHVGPTDRQPHPNPARSRDHRRASTSTTAAAKAGDTEAGILTQALPTNSISIAGTAGTATPSPAGATST